MYMFCAHVQPAVYNIHRQKSAFSFHQDIETASRTASFHNAIAVANVEDDTNMYRLHR